MFFYPTGLLSAKGEEEKGDEEMWQRKDLKLQVPVKVTTPRSGPLQLGGRDSLPSPSSPPQRCFTRRRKRSWADPQMPRPLTRNYVPDLCRPPIVVVEQSLLEGLSCADLREEVQLLIDMKPNSLACPLLPHLLHTPSWSSSLPPSHHGPMESYTHTDSLGPMNVAITFSRHRLNKSHLHLPSLQPSPGHTSTTESIQKRLPSAVGGKLRLHRSPCAPHSLTAISTHKRQPITSSTFVSGQHYPHPH